MKMIIKHTLRILLLICILYSLRSCEKFVVVDSPVNAVDSKILFSTQNGYEGAIRGMYYNMLMVNLSLTNGGLPVYLSLAADELIPRSNNANYQGFYQNSLLSSNSVVSSFWASAYDGIYRANILLENIQQDSYLNTDVADDYRGQALFVRAFYYLYLIQLFGDVPLILDTDYRKNAIMPRVDQNLVLDQVIGDLTEASLIIKKNGRSDKAIPNYYAVISVLSRAHLLDENFQSVADLCDIIINDGGFVLEDVSKVFEQNSRETIWQLTSEYRNVAEARSFVPANNSSIPLFYFTDSFLSIYAADDTRRKTWINENVISGTSYSYPFKYKERNNSPVKESNIVIRLAEVILMRAEARSKLSDMVGALGDLNAIRQRAMLDPIHFQSEGQFELMVEEERRRELFAEWGHRWFDLKRWKKLDSILAPIKPSWKEYASLLPIPYTQRIHNVFLTQNDGYDE